MAAPDRPWRLVAAAAAAVIPSMLLGGCLRSPLDRSAFDTELRASGSWTMTAPIDVPAPEGPDGCGAQALAAVLASHDDSEGSAAISAELPWHRTGATPVDLLLEARRRGWTARIASGDAGLLRREIEGGRPPLVMLDAGFAVHTLTTSIALPDVMHWAVVTGIAPDDAGHAGNAADEPGTPDVLLGAPGLRHHVVDGELFDRRWADADRCVLLLAPPGSAVPTSWATGQFDPSAAPAPAVDAGS